MHHFVLATYHWDLGTHSGAGNEFQILIYSYHRPLQGRPVCQKAMTFPARLLES